MLQEMLASLTGRFRRQAPAMPRLEPPAMPLDALCRAVIGTRALSSSMALAQRLLDRYAALTFEERRDFFSMLRREFGIDRASVAEAAHLAQTSGDYAALERLYTLAEPTRQHLLRRINQVPDGTAMLVELRADLLRMLDADPDLREVDYDFRHLFHSWFNGGFLELRRVDWNTSASILAKIIEYEAVHEIRDWSDLRSRIDPPDRRLYAFFHPRLPREPLVFVEVALCPDIPSGIGAILDRERPVIAAEAARTAVFYSISNCQDGLRGVSFGNLLIKQVVSSLRAEFPRLETFVTLSPVPGFARWLAGEAQNAASIVHAPAKAALERTAAPEWWLAPDAQETGLALTRLAAHYLVAAKRSGGEPVDPVARFHLGNGARLTRVNWPGNLSAAGLKGAHGVMVNYHYELGEIETNSETFLETGAVAASAAVADLAQQAVPASPTR
ncbi:MCD, Malonyl-CoA decarboxylase MCD [Arsenicitalea aurantiaca]|uniref:MCD, Malonyl-CoA decarboxylase MCD n=1 Tax=Arsenicitalea aurantiaca TaxID=1783274 RepID=A0A433X493_9HYPH|nr:malonyl-CoA decarboxylase [Arsenicitalea aurantiaca]RUT28884.1 MCD, Malonyl-CoA decarboxylase MCD [Arsenicitalea aurantiaca]